MAGLQHLCLISGIGHENSGAIGIGSDGEGEYVSSDEVLTPTVKLRNHQNHPKLANKRMSLPANMQMPPLVLRTSSPPSGDQPMTRRLRRASLVSSTHTWHS